MRTATRLPAIPMPAMKVISTAPILSPTSADSSSSISSRCEPVLFEPGNHLRLVEKVTGASVDFSRFARGVQIGSLAYLGISSTTSTLEIETGDRCDDGCRMSGRFHHFLKCSSWAMFSSRATRSSVCCCTCDRLSFAGAPLSAIARRMIERFLHPFDLGFRDEPVHAEGHGVLEHEALEPAGLFPFRERSTSLRSGPSARI